MKQVNNTLFCPGSYLWWRNNPSKPVMCLILSTQEDGFKILKLDNLSVFKEKDYHCLDFENPTDEEVAMFWETTQVSNPELFVQILKEHNLVVPVPEIF